MPKYKLPEPDKGDMEDMKEMAVGDDLWRRRISIPANKELVKEAEIGKEVEVTLKGKIIEISSRESEGGNGDSYFEVEVSEVELYAEGEFEGLADDEEDDE